MAENPDNKTIGNLSFGVYDGPHYGNTTTGKVAKALEEKYGLISIWIGTQKEQIQLDVSRAIASKVADIYGERQGQSTFSTFDRILTQTASGLRRQFAADVNSQRVERIGLRGNVPTKAAIDGVNHRFKSGFNNVSPAQARAFFKAQSKLPKDKRQKLRGDRRPSFVDTNVFLNSFDVEYVKVEHSDE